LRPFTIGGTPTVSEISTWFEITEIGTSPIKSGVLAVQDVADGVKTVLTLDVSDLPPGDLEISFMGRAGSGSPGNMDITFNGDDTADAYNSAFFRRGADDSDSGTGQDGVDNARIRMQISGDADTADYASSVAIDVCDYKGSTFFKGLTAFGNLMKSNVDGDTELAWISGLWKNTDAITSIEIETGTAWIAGTVVRATVKGTVIAHGTVETVQSSAYAVKASDQLVPYDTSGGAFSATLFVAGAANKGQQITFKEDVGNTNQLTLTAGAGQTIDRAATKALVTADLATTISFDGVSNWRRI
jgi:hypothetical protein